MERRWSMELAKTEFVPNLLKLVKSTLWQLNGKGVLTFPLEF